MFFFKFIMNLFNMSVVYSFCFLVLMQPLQDYLLRWTHLEKNLERFLKSEKTQPEERLRIHLEIAQVHDDDIVSQRKERRTNV